MGSIWSHLTEEQKKPYHDSFEVSKVKYKNFVEKKLAEWSDLKFLFLHQVILRW